MEEAQKRTQMLSGDISTVEKLMAHILQEKQEKSAILKAQITKQRAEKGDAQKQLLLLRKELSRLKQGMGAKKFAFNLEYSQGRPIEYLLEQAKALLEQPDVS